MIRVLCGIPASGKTTLGRELKEKYNAKLHSYDDVEDANDIAVCSMEEVYSRWMAGIKADINNGYDVICDSTNLTVKQRAKLLNHLKGFDTRKRLYIVNTPVEECLSRNSQRKTGRLPDFVITQSQEMYEHPSYAEGWNEIIFINSP